MTRGYCNDCTHYKIGDMRCGINPGKKLPTNWCKKFAPAAIEDVLGEDVEIIEEDIETDDT